MVPGMLHPDIGTQAARIGGGIIVDDHQVAIGLVNRQPCKELIVQRERVVDLLRGLPGRATIPGDGKPYPRFARRQNIRSRLIRRRRTSRTTVEIGPTSINQIMSIRPPGAPGKVDGRTPYGLSRNIDPEATKRRPDQRRMRAQGVKRKPPVR